MNKLAGPIEAYLTHLAVEKGLSGNTLASYRRDLDKYRDYLGLIGVDELPAITQTDITAFITYLSQGDAERGKPRLAATSVTRALSAVRNLHKFALTEGWVATDVTQSVAPPKQPQRYPKALSIAETTQLIDSIPDGDQASIVDLRDRAVVEFLYSTGARVSEVTELNLGDIDLEAHLVLLRGKGGKERIVPVGAPAIAAVEHWLVRGRPQWVRVGTHTKPGADSAIFLNSLGRRLSRQSAGNMLAQRGQAAGLSKKISPHTLRHSFGTHLIEGGADVRVVQELLGHASVTTTQIYTMVTADNLRRVWAGAHPRAL